MACTGGNCITMLFENKWRNTYFRAPVARTGRLCSACRFCLTRIARPFAGPPSNFQRTERRHDYAVEPPKPMLLDVLAESGTPVFGVGKIHDIYNGRGVPDYVTTKNNSDGMAKLTEAIAQRSKGLIFANLLISTCSTAIAKMWRDLRARWNNSTNSSAPLLIY